VTAADVTAAGTLYYTPYLHDQMSLFSRRDDFLRLRRYNFGELSLALVATSGSNYDVFAHDDFGTPRLELSLAWATDTGRTTALVYHRGILVKGTDRSRVYLGTFRASAANVTEESKTKRFVNNYYNRVWRALYSAPGYSDNNATNSYTTTSTTWVRANGGTGSRLEFLSNGEDAVDVAITVTATPSAEGYTLTGLGIDSITTATYQMTQFGPTGFNQASGLTGYLGPGDLPAGYHFFELLIAVNAAITGTWYADWPRQGGSKDSATTFVAAAVMG
jgi:hypothetical protein